jgi:hypothetical protein
MGRAVSVWTHCPRITLEQDAQIWHRAKLVQEWPKVQQWLLVILCNSELHDVARRTPLECQCTPTSSPFQSCFILPQFLSLYELSAMRAQSVMWMATKDSGSIPNRGCDVSVRHHCPVWLLIHTAFCPRVKRGAAWNILLTFICVTCVTLTDSPDSNTVEWFNFHLNQTNLGQGDQFYGKQARLKITVKRSKRDLKPAYWQHFILDMSGNKQDRTPNHLSANL